MPLATVLARYSKAAAVAPTHSSLSREEQVVEFCNVCVSEAVSEAAIEVDVSNIRDGLGLKYFHALPFFKDLLFIAVGCPFMFFLCLTPLWFADGWVYEMWKSYYWFWMSLSCSLFGRSNMLVSWGCGPEIRTVVLWAAISSILSTAVCVAACETPRAGFAADVSAVFVLLYLPTLYILRVCREEQFSIADFIQFVSGFTMGALPCCVSAALYYYAAVRQAGQQYEMFIYVLVWACSSALLKGLGKRMWAGVTPNCKVFGPIMWVFYIEVAMDGLGIRIFFSSVWSALFFSITFLPTAVLNLLKGSEKYHSLIKAKESISMRRLIVMVEVFTSCVGRLAALTMYLCFSSMQLATGKTRVAIMLSKPSLFREQMGHQNTVDIYRNSKVDLGKPWIAMVGMLQVLVIFAGFMALSARLWTAGAASTTKVTPSESHACETPPTPSGSDSNGAAAESSSDPVGSVQVGDTAVRRPGQWWDELYQGEAKIHPLDLLSTFVIQFWSYFLCCVGFVFALSPLVVSVAERSRLGTTGESSGDSIC